MLTFNQLSEKKSQVKINPKQADLKEKIKHGEDCECQKCDDRRDKEEPTVEGTAYGIYKGDGKRKLPGDKKKKHDCASKVKHEEYGIGDCISEAHDLDENGNVAHYDVEFEEYIVKGIPVEQLEILEGSMHEHVIQKEATLATARKNIGRDPKKPSCWDGYKAKGTKMKGGKAVPNCVKEEDLEEERSARKMNVRTKGTIKKQIAKDAAAEAKRKEKKTGEYKETPKKRPSLKKPSQLTKVKAAKAKPAAKKKEAPRTQKGAMAYDGPNKERSQAADRVKAKTKAKQKTLPKKKSGLGDRVKDVIKKGVKRHRKATQGARVFAKGAAKGAKDTVKFAGKLKKAVVGEERLITYKELVELNRYAKETGKNTGSMNKKPGSSVKKGGSDDKALNFVRGMIRKEQGKPVGQQKKVKGVKSTAGTGKYLDKSKAKKAVAAKAKKAGFKTTQAYANTMARYGGEDNYKKGRGLGT